ncbi:hypothetical protein MKW92_012574 [Papaver armeniacum]|nr:hypothetical protein MKW92_012574 [Papaver armeniacum]
MASIDFNWFGGENWFQQPPNPISPINLISFTTVFAIQFFFGLWGFRQRPYPAGRPIDVAQAIEYKRIEIRYYYYCLILIVQCSYNEECWLVSRRLFGSSATGPLQLITLKPAWDKDTFIWGEDMDEWGLWHSWERVSTWDVRLGAAATSFVHKLQNSIPPWVPPKGEEKKSYKLYKQLQEEAIASKNRDFAVLEANDGEIIAKKNPCLKPWEVLSIQQANDQIAYSGIWYCERLGSNATGPPYLRNWNKYVKSYRVYNKLAQTIPRFREVMRKVPAESDKKQNGKMAAEDNGT